MNIKQYSHKAKIKGIQFWRTKNVKLYLFFVVVATLFWFLHSLGKEYVANIDVDIRYENFPEDKEPMGNVVRTHRLNVKAYGFSLVRMQFDSFFGNYEIDLNQLKRHSSLENGKLRYDLSISAVRNQLEGQLASGISINSIFPEEVVFQVRTMQLKKVPIRTNVKLEIQSGYRLENKPKVIPDSVMVRGLKKVVDTLQAVYAKELIVKDAASSFEEEVDLYSPNKEVVLLQNTAVIQYEIGAYIDEERVVAIKPLNFPDSVKVVLSPASVKLKYRTEVDTKRSISDEDFLFVVDYNTLSEFSQKLEVQALNLPKGISKVHMTPRYVNYVISYKKQ